MAEDSRGGWDDVWLSPVLEIWRLIVLRKLNFVGGFRLRSNTVSVAFLDSRERKTTFVVLEHAAGLGNASAPARGKASGAGLKDGVNSQTTNAVEFWTQPLFSCLLGSSRDKLFSQSSSEGIFITARLA